jgi:hypothetical protein
MEKDKTCRDIYFEMRSMNRHLQRVGNIGMLALLLKLEDDKNGKRLLKAAAILVGVVEVLLFQEAVTDCIKKRNGEADD